MRETALMSDRTGNDAPVQVQLEFSDWRYVPNRTYRHVLEIDREDWNGWDPTTRREEVEQMQREWLENDFGLSYEVLGDASFDDPVTE